jgi:hypothetical protein
MTRTARDSQGDVLPAVPSEARSTEAANTAKCIDEMLPCVRIPRVVSRGQSSAIQVLVCGLSGRENRKGRIKNLEHANKTRYPGHKRFIRVN